MMLFFPLYTDSLILITLLQENPTNFDDLGKLLLGGVAAAIVVAVGFTVVRFRLRDKKPQTSSFISISSDRE
jgi:hypothetical protein